MLLGRRRARAEGDRLAERSDQIKTAKKRPGEDEAELTFIKVLRAASYCPWAQDFRASSIPPSIMASGVLSSAILLFSSAATQKNRGGEAMRRRGRVDFSIGVRPWSRNTTRKNHSSRLANHPGKLIAQSALFTGYTESKIERCMACQVAW